MINDLKNLGNYYKRGILTYREALHGIRDVLGYLPEDEEEDVLKTCMKGNVHDIARVVMRLTLVPIFGYININASPLGMGVKCSVAYNGSEFDFYQIEYDDFVVFRASDGSFVGRYSSVSEAAVEIIHYRREFPTSTCGEPF